MAVCAKRSGQQSDTDCKMFHPILDQVNDYVILYRSLCFSSRNRKGWLCKLDLQSREANVYLMKMNRMRLL